MCQSYVHNFQHVYALVRHNPIPQYVFVPPMEWIPHPSHALIQASHHPASLDPLDLLSIRIPQQFCFLQDLLFLEIPDADDLFPAIDVGAPDYGMCIWSGGDVDDDLRVGFCERGDEWRAEECAERVLWRISKKQNVRMDEEILG